MGVEEKPMPFVENILRTKGSHVVSVTTRTTVDELVSILAEHDIGAVVVLNEDGTLAGIVSERDVVRHLARISAALLDQPVSALMNAAPVTCCGSDSLDRVMGHMTRRRARHLPVVEEGVLVGIVSIGDVVKRKIEEVEQEAEVLRDYIAS